MNGKGSGRRPRQVSEAEWARRHALTFPPKKKPKLKPIGSVTTMQADLYGAPRCDKHGWPLK